MKVQLAVGVDKGVYSRYASKYRKSAVKRVTQTSIVSAKHRNNSDRSQMLKVIRVTCWGGDSGAQKQRNE